MEIFHRFRAAGRQHIWGKELDQSCGAGILMCTRIEHEYCRIPAPVKLRKPKPFAQCKVWAERPSGCLEKKKGSVETPPVHTKTTQREN
jgi:hypothetical protein